LSVVFSGMCIVTRQDD